MTGPSLKATSVSFQRYGGAVGRMKIASYVHPCSTVTFSLVKLLMHSKLLNSHPLNTILICKLFSKPVQIRNQV